MKGNCLNPSTFKDSLHDVDGIIHSVGAFFEDKSNPCLTYEAMNRDTAINMARELNELASEDEQRKFVMISSSEAHP